MILRFALNAAALALLPGAGQAAISSKRQKPPPKKAVIVLDPGHGGRDPGAIGVRGTMEKFITLALAREIRRRLEGRSDLSVALTRDGDTLLPLEERVAIAQDFDADFFVSLHADAAPAPRARGLSVYTLSEKASDAFASALAERENKVDSLYGIDLKHIDKDTAQVLLDLARRRSHAASYEARQRLVNGVEGHVRLLENPMRSANFAVLRSAQVPSILIESGFLSNPEDEKLLADPKFRANLAHVLATQIAGIAVDLKVAA